MNNDEDKKHHKYTLDEILQAVLELDDEIDSQIYYGLVWSMNPTTVNNYNLFLFLTLRNRNALLIHDVWVIVVHYLGYVKHSCFLYFRTTILLQ